MTASTALVTTNQPQAEDDMFSDLEPISAFEVKKDYLATQLAALMSFCGKSRSDMAEGLGWQKSRVTRVLSGKDNLTVKTIWEFSSYLGFDYDVVFHATDQPRPNQPWQIKTVENPYLQAMTVQTLYGSPHPSALGTSLEAVIKVAIDMAMRNHGNFYFNMTLPVKEDPITWTQRTSLDAHSLLPMISSQALAVSISD